MALVHKYQMRHMCIEKKTQRKEMKKKTSTNNILSQVRTRHAVCHNGGAVDGQLLLAVSQKNRQKNRIVEIKTIYFSSFYVGHI